MSSVASDSNEIILKQVSRCRRRLLCLILLRAFAWSGAILITGMGLSRFKIPFMPVLTIFIACFVAAYYLWHHYPLTNQVVRIIDERLSLKEGLVTAFQFQGSQGRFVPLLINQISPKFTRASSRQIFPFKIPGVLLAWPFLLALMIVPAETGPLRFFNFHQSQGDVESLKADAGDTVQEGIVNREGGGIPSDTNLEPTKGNENVIPAQAGIQNDGIGLDSHVRGNDGELGAFSGETPMSRLFTKADENPLPGRDRVEMGFSGGTHPHLNPLPEGEEIGTGGFSAETLMPLQGTKEHKDVIPAQAGIQNDGRGLDSHFRRNDGDGKEWIPTYVGMTDAVHPAVVQILARQDIPKDYKEYVKSYFDVIQKEGLDHGEE